MLMAGPVGQFLQVMDKIRDLATNKRRSKTVNLRRVFDEAGFSSEELRILAAMWCRSSKVHLRRVFDEADSGGSGRIGQRELFKMFINRGASSTHLR